MIYKMHLHPAVVALAVPPREHMHRHTLRERWQGSRQTCAPPAEDGVQTHAPATFPSGTLARTLPAPPARSAHTLRPLFCRPRRVPGERERRAGESSGWRQRDEAQFPFGWVCVSVSASALGVRQRSSSAQCSARDQSSGRWAGPESGPRRAPRSHCWLHPQS